MFIDRTTIKVKGGDGGKGCVSFRREKYVPRGGPNGGDGGDGGSVILRATVHEQSFVELYYMPHHEGRRGQHGLGKDCHGVRGADCVVRVPVGTVVRDASSGEVLADLSADGQEFAAARGGRGGAGNTRFRTPENRAPHIAGPGEPGEERELLLELKTVADVGLVGYPNAGKSTLISAVSDAHPKTAPYPFTTRHPNVGVVTFPDFYRFTVADIPGLMDGAHRNVGLGHDFLRHIERCRILVYVLDTAGVDNRLPWDDLDALRRELELYKEGLTAKPSVIVANKMDLPEAAENLKRLRKHVGRTKVLAISALEHHRTGGLMKTLRQMLEDLAPRQEA
ncbi:MAG: GTPase ObgE [Lentisphaerae bacterium ADurb.BinA184]|nr:MAG: GTPase ObgE [Lentisphaerae bacterium ADurb.BinA184]